MIVNLISDTVTKPSKEMLQAMLNAEVGDDVFKEDPSVNKLEELIAKMFNKSSALFFPSGNEEILPNSTCRPTLSTLRSSISNTKRS